MYEKIIISHDTLVELGHALYEAEDSKAVEGYKIVTIPIDTFNMVYQACCASRPERKEEYEIPC